ncbi:PTB domain-containing engulfment adapter protein 1-like [Arapaima gigas]
MKAGGKGVPTHLGRYHRCGWGVDNRTRAAGHKGHPAHLRQHNRSPSEEQFYFKELNCPSPPADTCASSSRRGGVNMYEEDVEIAFAVKFLGRTEVLRPNGPEVLQDAAEMLKRPEEGVSDKSKKKKHKVSLFLSTNGIDILEHDTKFLLYTCTLSSVSYCAVHRHTPHVFGFVAQHPVVDVYHCYLFQSKKFSHLLVSMIGDMFQSSKRNEGVKGSRDLVVEALRHKNNLLLKENTELKKRLAALLGKDISQSVSAVQCEAASSSVCLPHQYSCLFFRSLGKEIKGI